MEFEAVSCTVLRCIIISIMKITLARPREENKILVFIFELMSGIMDTDSSFH